MAKANEPELKHYLLLKTFYFIDPHGTADEGGYEKSIIDENEIIDLDGEDRNVEFLLRANGNYIQFGQIVDETYIEACQNGCHCDCNLAGNCGCELEDYCECDIDENSEYRRELQGGEDGYNMEATMINIKEITAEQAAQYKLIIEQYNAIK